MTITKEEGKAHIIWTFYLFLARLKEQQIPMAGDLVHGILSSRIIQVSFSQNKNKQKKKKKKKKIIKKNKALMYGFARNSDENLVHFDWIFQTHAWMME